jgi:hypothetical protein
MKPAKGGSRPWMPRAPGLQSNAPSRPSRNCRRTHCGIEESQALQNEPGQTAKKLQKRPSLPAQIREQSLLNQLRFTRTAAQSNRSPSFQREPEGERCACPKGKSL